MKKQLGHYEIVAEIGRGGMGVVYKGYEPSLARYVAIKELSPTFAHDTVVVERFLREARSMALLNDPHIIQIYSIGQENDEPFFVMEFVDGVSVATLIKRDRQLDADDALKIVLETARGLSTAHDQGVIHRDIKPANLMINQRGQVKIADFGIALATHDASAKLTSVGDVVGTAAYLSPEATQGNAVDARSEVYSVGVVLFEMLAGRTPFSDSNVYKLMHEVVEKEAPDVREFNPDIDADIVAILSRMLAKDPADRYQNMHELIADLKKHPSVNGPIRVNIPPPSGSTGTMVGLSTPMTPGARPRVPTPPPDVGKGQASTPAAMAAVSSPSLRATGEPAQASLEAPTTRASWLKSLWAPLVLSLLMFLAGVTWAVRGQITDFFGAAHHAQTTSANAPSSGSPATADTPAVHKTPTAVYVEAAIVTVLALAGMGFWFGVHRRRQGETEAGIRALANMKWRDCIRLALEVLSGDGYVEAPVPRQTGDGGTEFLLLRGNERVWLDFKLGTAYRIDEANVREFAKGLDIQGATRGILMTLGSIDDSVRDLAKRCRIELIDGVAIWPKVRPYLPADILDHVRLQVGAQTGRGLLIGSVSSVLLGMATFLFASQATPDADGTGFGTVAAAPRAAAAPQPVDVAAIRKSIANTEAKRAETASLTPEQLTERRAKAAKEVSTIDEVAHANWYTESTLELHLKKPDVDEANLIAQVCKILTQYDEMRLTRLQIDPLDPATGYVRWGQCQ